MKLKNKRQYLSKLVLSLLILSLNNLNVLAQRDFVCELKEDNSLFALGGSRVGFHYSSNEPEIKITISDNQKSIIRVKDQKVIHNDLNEILPKIDGKIIIQDKRGKFGVLNKDGTNLITTKYDDLFYETIEPEFYCAVKLDGKWGFLDANEKIILPIKYDKIRLLDQSRAIVSLADTIALFDLNSLNLIDVTSYCVQAFKEKKIHKFFKIQSKEKIGVMSSSGDIIIEPIYDDIQYFDSIGVDCSQFVFRLRQNYLYGLANQCGKIFIPIEYNRISKLNRKLQKSVIELRKYSLSYIYSNGVKSKIGFDNVNLAQPEEDVLIVRSLNKYGLFELTSNRIQIPTVYNELKRLNNSEYYIGLKECGYGLLDKYNNSLTEFVFDIAPVIYSNNKDDIQIKIRRDGLFGVLNNRLKYILKPAYHSLDSKKDERIRVMKFNLWGYLDESFNVVVSLDYDYAHHYSSGVAKVYKENKEMIIDKNGVCIENCQ